MKIFKVVFCILTSCLMFGYMSRADAGLTATKHIMKNGLTVLTTEISTSPMVAIYALVKTGSAREGKFLGCGISHFLEHMAFKGTEKRGVGEIPALVQSLGGTINAATSFDYTIYTINLPCEHFDLGLDILADMVMRPKFDAIELEKEREVILKEMEMHNDDPDRRLSEVAFQTVYIAHPYRHPIIGYPDLLRKVSREDIVEYHNTKYAPNNTILSIAGNVDSEQAWQAAQKMFGEFKRTPDWTVAVKSEPVQISQRYYEERYPTEVTRLSLLFAGVSINDDDMVGLDVLARILGQGYSSRLYTELYQKKKLVYGIEASNFTPIDQGAFEIEAQFDENKWDAVFVAIKEVIKNIQQKEVSKREFDKIKSQIKSEYVFNRQTASSLAYSQVFGEADMGDANYDDYYLKAVDRLTTEDIQRVAKKYLIEEKMSVVLLKPKLETVEQKKSVTENAVGKGDFEKFVFKNGLTVLLRDDHSFPLVSIRLAANGGVLAETPENNGVFNAFASVWTEGTKKKDWQQLAQILDEKGMTLEGYAGNNSFGLVMNCLKGDIFYALELLNEVVVAPSFPLDQIEKTKDNMLMALKQRKDDIMDESDFVFRQELFGSHPYALDSNGNEQSIVTIDQTMIKDIYRKYVVPSNMILAISGDIDIEKTRKEIERLFDVLSNKSIVNMTNPSIVEIIKPIEKTIYLDKKQAVVYVGFLGLDLKDNQRFALKVLMTMLGSSFEGRLFQKIREDLGQAYRVGGYSVPGKEQGWITLYALTMPESVETVKKIITNEIADIQKGNVTDKEINDAKAYLKGTFVAGLETNAALNFTVLLDELYGLGFNRYKSFETDIEAVTREQIIDAAKQYLNLDKRVVILALPQELKK